MNVAFSAVLAFLILAPGLLFYRVRHITAEQANLRPLPPQAFSVEVVGAIIVAAFLHTVCCLVVYFLSLFCHVIPAINFDAIMRLMLGRFGPQDTYLTQSIESVTDHPIAILAYSLLIGVAAIKLAKLSEKPKAEAWLSRCGLSPAHTAVIGEWEEFFNITTGQGAIVTAVVEMAGTSYLFAGFLTRLYFDRESFELDRLQLEDVLKRKLRRAGRRV